MLWAAAFVVGALSVDILASFGVIDGTMVGFTLVSKGISS